MSDVQGSPGFHNLPVTNSILTMALLGKCVEEVRAIELFHDLGKGVGLVARVEVHPLG